MTAQSKAGHKAGDVVQRPTGLAVVSQFQELVTTVPLAEDGDGLDIIARVLTAESIDDLANDDGLPSSKDLAPFAPYVQGISRRPSDHPGNTGFYLIVDAVTTHGEPLRFSAGGEQTIAMLAKLHQLGAFPIQCSFDKVSTKGGREAVNCKPIPSTANGRRD